jgi:DNA polymerase III delta prime subunit
LDSKDLPNYVPIFEPCLKCDRGYLPSGEAITKCSCLVKHEEILRLLIGLEMSNLITSNSSKESVNQIIAYDIKQYLGKDKAQIISKVKKYIAHFSEKYSSLNLFFSGNPGTQKTTVAKFIAKSLLQKNKKCYYVLASPLIQTISNAERVEEEKAKLDYITNCDLLIIDDFSEDQIVTFQSGWQRKNLFPWLKYRLETIKKATIFISNKTIDNLGDYFEGAIQDVIAREVPDKTMIFEDKYSQLSEKVDISKIWD